jgi:hypothetical protein
MNLFFSYVDPHQSGLPAYRGYNILDFLKICL